MLQSEDELIRIGEKSTLLRCVKHEEPSRKRVKRGQSVKFEVPCCYIMSSYHRPVSIFTKAANSIHNPFFLRAMPIH
jgi:hypothetical protein